MSIWFWTIPWTDDPLLWDGWVVLHDGQNTYWDDEMRPSGGYTSKSRMKRQGFIYIGEL